MTTELGLALPPGGVQDLAAMKAAFAAAFPLAIADLAAFELEDIASEPYNSVVYNGNVYAYDAADTTSASDGGATVIVASGRRYALESAFRPGYQVKSKVTAAPPGSSALGDRYVIPIAPTGDWASHARKIATWSARGWVYATASAGDIVWIDDVATYAHYSAAGEWTDGLPISAISPSSIDPTKLVHPAGLRVTDTLSAPPGGSPSDHVAYLVGASPTGDFSGEENSIAYRLGAAWVFISPTAGDTIFEVALGKQLSFKSGVWEDTIVKPARSAMQRISGNFPTLSYATDTNILVNTVTVTSFDGMQAMISFVTGGTVVAGTSVARVCFLRVFYDAETTPRYTMYQKTTEIGAVQDHLGHGVPSAVIDFDDALEHDVHIKIYCSGGVWAPTAMDYDIVFEELNI